MSETWPTHDVEGILRQKNAKEERLPGGVFGFVTRGKPVTAVAGGRDLEIHGSTEVFVDGRWQSLLGVVYENVAAFRRRESMRVTHGAPKRGDDEVRAIVERHMEEALAEIANLELQPTWPRSSAEMRMALHLGKKNVWMDIVATLRIKNLR